MKYLLFILILPLVGCAGFIERTTPLYQLGNGQRWSAPNIKNIPPRVDYRDYHPTLVFKSGNSTTVLRSYDPQKENLRMYHSSFY